MQTKEDPKAQLRLKNFTESKLNAFQSKFGLFSFAGTLAIQPHSYDQSPSPRRAKDGSVIIHSRNIVVSPVKSGKGTDAYFSVPGFLCSGDKYVDPTKIRSPKRINAAKIKSVHDQPFKDPGPFELKAEFEHMTELKPMRKRNKSTMPRNFYTSPMKKGTAKCTPGLTFGEFEYLPNQSLVKAKKISSNTEKFKPSSNTPRLFDDKIYNAEGITMKPKSSTATKPVKIETPFKPTSPSRDCFSAFEYVPPRSTTPGGKKLTLSDKVPWKATNKQFTTPTSTIALLFSNLKKDFKIL
jgi:hypothetical protein